MAILYPPIPPSVIPAIGDWVFNEDEQSTWFKTLELSYQVPIGVSIDEYDAMLVKIVDQANNKSIVSDYRDYLIIDTNSGLNKEKNIVSIPIYKDAEKIYTDKPLVGHIYKIQLAFYNTISKKQSEWSQITAFKRILIDPNFPINASQIENNTLAPLFQGSIKFTVESAEWVDKYRFTLFDDQGQLLEESDWIQNDAFNESGMSYRFKTVLQHKHNYNLQFDIISNNGYKTGKYVGPIVITQYNSEIDPSYSLIVEENYEEAYNNISILYNPEDHSNKVIESFIITRSDETTNYELWEDFKRVGIQDLLPGHTYDLCRDYTIESGVGYKYAFQIIYQDSYGRESRSGRTEDPRPHIIYLQYSYLYHNGKQLKLNFNNKLSTFKHTVLAAKQDSLGGKYPIISRNGNAYYAEFPITGLISMLMDDNQTFLQHKEKGYYYNDELIIPERHFDGVDLNSNLTPGNIYIERKFRDKVIEFLEDGDYKLYRSPTEGNFIITLMNISLTPNQQLGRMISEFTSTAYEVGEFNLKSLNDLGIHSIGDFPKELYIIDTFTGQFKTVANENIFTTLFRENTNLLNNYEDIKINSLLFLPRETGFIDSIVLNQENKNILIPTIYSYPANISINSNGEWPNWSVNTSDLIIAYTASGRPKSIQDTYKNTAEIKLLPGVQKGHIGNIIIDKESVELISRITEHDCNPESEIVKIYNNFYDFINLVIELNSGEEISLHFAYSDGTTKDIALKNNDINIYNIPLEGERVDTLIAKSTSTASFNIYFTYLAKEETIDVSSLN